jgi:orotate phosphoribosyltransferase-like protein
MSKVVSCRDVGVESDLVAKGETEHDILQQCKGMQARSTVIGMLLDSASTSHVLSFLGVEDARARAVDAAPRC